MSDQPTETKIPAQSADPVAPAQTGAVPEGNNPPAETNNFQQRINTVVGERNAERARADSLQQQVDASKKEDPVAAGVEPSLENFDYDEAKYNKAVIDHRIKQGIEEATAELKVSQQKFADDQRNALALTEFEKKRIEFEKTTKDYAKVVGNLSSIQFPQDTLNMIMQVGPALAHHLGNNLDVALSISQMPLNQAAMKLGMLTSALSPATTQTAPSTAPEPIDAIKSGGPVPSGQDYENMSMEQIAAL